MTIKRIGNLFGTFLVLGWLVPVALAADLVNARDGSGVYGYKDTPKLPWCDYLVHDPDRPAPRRINPGPAPAPVAPPSDAVVLFDGKDLSQWQATKWKLVDGRAEPVYKIRMASSADGIDWSKANKDLIVSRLEEDEAQASPDVVYANGKYHMFYCDRYSRHYRG